MKGLSGGGSQYFTLTAALMVCRLTGSFCSDEDFKSMCNSVEAQFERQSERNRNLGNGDPILIESDTEEQSRLPSSASHSQNSLADSQDSRFLSPTSRRKRLRQCHQLCKPLSPSEVTRVTTTSTAACLALKQRDEYIDLLKLELAKEPFPKLMMGAGFVSLFAQLKF